MIPGEYKLSDEKVPYNVGYEAISLEVKNVGDRAVQVGSHYHFYEANEEGLRFDRKKAFGKRLDIPAGTAVRFEPCMDKKASLAAARFCATAWELTQRKRAKTTLS